VDPRAGLDVVVRKKDTTQKARSWCLEWGEKKQVTPDFI
jgi:hypothetical protein